MPKVTAGLQRCTKSLLVPPDGGWMGPVVVTQLITGAHFTTLVDWRFSDPGCWKGQGRRVACRRL